MRFLFFNIVVGTALLYLYKGGDIDFSYFARADNRPPEILAANKPQPKPAKPGHARDVIDEPKAPVLAPKPSQEKTMAPAPKTVPKTVVTEQPKIEKLPEIKNPITVAKRIPKVPHFDTNTISEDPAVARRRSEVMETASAPSSSQDFALKEGTSLMSTADRRQSLDRLAEEMELLFLETVGG